MRSLLKLTLPPVPSIYTDVTADDALMQEEIFGPVLPIMDIGSVDEAIRVLYHHSVLCR